MVIRCAHFFFGGRVEVFCVLFQISLVDLAGSERANKTGATAEQLKVIPSLPRILPRNYTIHVLAKCARVSLGVRL